MRVKMLPAGQDHRLNPYTATLCAALTAAGSDVSPATTFRQALAPCDVMHVHWPYNYASIPSLAKALARSGLLILLSILVRLRGGKIVWTVHGLHSLQSRHRWLEWTVMAIFTRLTQGVIFLNRATEAALIQRRPYMSRRPHVRIPHGLYGLNYPPPTSKGSARRELGLSERSLLVVLPGDIKPYKQPEAVLDAVADRAPPDLLLLLAGRCDPPEFEIQVQAKLAAAALRHPGIIWLNSRLSDAELAQVIDAADVVALPYGVTWNSGLAILVLERRRRLLCSDAPSFKELADELGAYWVHLAEGGVNGATLRALSREPPSMEDEQRLDRFLGERRWDAIATRTCAFYEQVAA